MAAGEEVLSPETLAGREKCLILAGKGTKSGPGAKGNNATCVVTFSPVIHSLTLYRAQAGTGTYFTNSSEASVRSSTGTKLGGKVPFYKNMTRDLSHAYGWTPGCGGPTFFKE